MKICIEKLLYSDTFRIWKEDKMLGPLKSEMTARTVKSKEDIIKEFADMIDYTGEIILKSKDEGRRSWING